MPSLLLSLAAVGSSVPVSGDQCAHADAYSITNSKHAMEGGDMYCVYPTATNRTDFPLISFEHGDVGGGMQLSIGYKSFLQTVASSGFVICAPLLCPISCRDKQHIHQLNAITAAKALGASGDLPIRGTGVVGIAGHSTGGMTTLKCAAADSVAEHNIGSAFVYNGDGGSEIQDDNVQFADIEATLPMFLVTGTRDIIEPKGSTESNHGLILSANPTQPLLVAMIDGEGHLDPNDIPIVHPAPLRAGPYFVAFFAYTLSPSDACNALYKVTLGDDLAAVSPSFYDNQLFSNMSSFSFV